MIVDSEYMITLSLCSVLRIYPPAFGRKLTDMFKLLVSDKAGCPKLPATVPSSLDTFVSMAFDDLWGEAHMQSVCHWLRGGKELNIPEPFKSHLPTKL